MKRIITIMLIIVTLALVFSVSASASERVEEVVLDIVILRPLGVAATIVGTALFIASLPFSIPSRSVNDTARVLVVAPFNYTFTRPLGYVGYPSYTTIGATSQPQPKESLQSSSDKVFIYPRQGQSDQQQMIDQDACHRLAVGQTGYDPTRPPGGVSDPMRKAEYQRAMGACLDARGYTVK